MVDVMDAALPDVSLSEPAARLGPLEWVGMQGIDLPILLVEPGYRHSLHARCDLQVNLPLAHIKGIHMSRLYRLLDDMIGQKGISPPHVRRVLAEMIDSHRDCASDAARLSLSFGLLVRRPALISEGLAGWKSYPVRLEATLNDAGFSMHAEVTIAYSSTCPCSAALSRRWVERGFLDRFPDVASVEVGTVAAWLREHATMATPHSQRSEAVVRVEVPCDAADAGLLELIDCVERALSTPVQTAVRRVDEQAFAVLNGANLMFVEDAARRIHHALGDRQPGARVHVRHLESLHPHDAVAWAGG